MGKRIVENLKFLPDKLKKRSIFIGRFFYSVAARII